jgi:CDP-glucose 4,6-dehydratase
LALDATKANQLLGWKDKLEFSEAIQWTSEWHSRVENGQDSRKVSFEQFNKFISS